MNEGDYLKKILELSKMSFDLDEVPVGAIVVKNGVVIGEGINDRERSHLITGHAEINAINNACIKINDWRLDDCDMYITLKPCMMCTGALIESRIRNVFYLCERTNVRFNDYSFLNLKKINNIYFENMYLDLLKKFFENKRI